MICFTKIICVFSSKIFHVFFSTPPSRRCSKTSHSPQGVGGAESHQGSHCDPRVLRCSAGQQRQQRLSWKLWLWGCEVRPPEFVFPWESFPMFFFVCSPGLDFSQRSQWKYSYKGEHDFKNGMKMFQIVCFNVFFFLGARERFLWRWHVTYEIFFMAVEDTLSPTIMEVGNVCIWKVTTLLVGGFKYFFFTPRILGEDSQFDEHIFSIGLVQPPTRKSFKVFGANSSRSEKPSTFDSSIRIPKRVMFFSDFLWDFDPVAWWGENPSKY